MPAPRKYDEETQSRAVRMYADRLAEGISRSVRHARKSVRCWGSTRRRCVTGSGASWARGTTLAGASVAGESAAEELSRLRRENAQLRRANEILRTSAAFFAAAELDRKIG